MTETMLFSPTRLCLITVSHLLPRETREKVNINVILIYMNCISKLDDYYCHTPTKQSLPLQLSTMILLSQNTRIITRLTVPNNELPSINHILLSDIQPR